MFKDYYQILGLNRDSFSQDDLKQVYRELSRQYHPDSSKAKEEGTVDANKFIEATEAYEMLKDDTKRSHYDEIYSKRLAENKEPETAEKESEEAYSSFRQENKVNEQRKNWAQRAFVDFDTLVKALENDEVIGGADIDLWIAMQREAKARGERDRIRSEEKLVKETAERKLQREERERERIIKENEERQQFLEKIVSFPEDDLKLVSAVAKINSDPSIDAINIKSEDGKTLWEIRKQQSAEGYNLDIRRSVAEFAQDDPSVIRAEGSIFEIFETNSEGEREVVEANLNKTYSVGDIGASERISNYRVPYGYEGYVDALVFVGRGISDTKEFDSKRLEENINYIEVASSGSMSLKKELRLKEISGLIDNRVAEIVREVVEGKPPVR